MKKSPNGTTQKSSKQVSLMSRHVRKFMRTIGKAASFDGGFLVALGVGIGGDATAATAAADLAQSACFQKQVAAIHTLKGPNRISFNPVSGHTSSTMCRRSVALKADQIRPWGGAPRCFRGPSEATTTAPIPRRFAEEVGVRRGSFSNKKMAASNRKYGRPLSVSLRQDFADFMRRHGGRAGPGFVEGTAPALRALDTLVLRPIPLPLRLECKSWIKLPALHMGERAPEGALSLEVAAGLPVARSLFFVPQSDLSRWESVTRQ